MKRGLVKLDPAEIPDTERKDRVAALQRAIAAEGIDVALIYGDVSRSDDIAYLTNLCIYWNEGILAVPATGDPAFLTKLSPRVFGWMREISTVADIRSGRKFGDLAVKLLEDRPSAIIGLIDAGLWPASVAGEVRQALAGHDIRDTGDLVRQARLAPSEHETALLRQGGGLLAGALGAATADGLTPAARIAAVERGLRGQGFLDVFASAGEAPDGVTSLRVTAQYRTLWVHASRLVPDVQAGSLPVWAASMGRSLAAAVGASRPGVTAAGLADATRPALTELPDGATAQLRWTHQADMATNGEYASYPADLPIPAGTVAVITVDVTFPDGRHAQVADTVVVTPDGGESITEPALEAAL
jgi:Xaa-Pro aminopeptidase